MYKELKKYQEKAVDKLISRTKELLKDNKENPIIVFKAPTGSGKTFMMSQYILEIIEELRGIDVCFLWLSPGKGKLHEQSFRSLKNEFDGVPNVYLLEQEFFGSRKTINKSEIVVGNWEKLSNKDSKTGKWKSNLMKDKETTNFRELIENTKKSGVKIILIIDESHSRDKADRAYELRDDIIIPDITIEMSATPKEIGDEKVEVVPKDVIEEEMIKKEIIVNENIDTLDNKQIPSQELILEMAYRKRIQIEKEYTEEGVEIKPLVLIQIPVSSAGEDKQKFIEHFLAEKGITKDNHKLAVWLTEEKVNQEAMLISKNDNEVEFLIFKQAIDTGWDCPRAQILVGFREIKSTVFKIQIVGRILRMPEAKHYGKDNLDKAFIYTNVGLKDLDFEGEEDWITKNIIKSIFVKRDEIYKPLKIKSYYRNRIDFGDITSGIYDVLDGVFCNEFDIKVGDFSKTAIEKNKKNLKDNKIDIESLFGKEDLILNKKLDVLLFDHLPSETLKSNENFQAYLSGDDKERVFENIVKINLNGYAPKRSMPIVKNALYRWFKKYIGINLAENGIIFIQNVVLNNANIFGRLLDMSIKSYAPKKEKEIKEKIEELEEWNENWEVAENRNYSDTYKPSDFDLSLYKNPKDKKTYLNFDSKIEEEFVVFLEENKNKILWWWQNGNEHMAVNFGVKYDVGSTFQPDFLVMFLDGRLGIFDTKAVGQREEENKLKAEALQKYIREENKRKKKDFIFGGLIIKEGNFFLINSDEKYEPFKIAEMVKEKEKVYGGKKQDKGWKYFEI